MKTYDIKVFRYDPSIDQGPRYEAYSLTTDAKMKVLDACGAIASEYDTDLAFRASCLMGRCGSCAVLLNGKAVMACQAIMEPGASVIEPLPGLPVIKDLIVDRTPYERLLGAVRPFVDETGYDRPKTYVYDRELYELTLCTDCLICQSVCPSRREIPAEFAGPAVLCQVGRYALDPRDQADRSLTALLTGLHSCTSCMTCSEVCPKGIDVFGTAIRRLREDAAGAEKPGPQVQRGMAETFRRTSLAIPKTGPLLIEELDLPESGEGTGVYLGCMLSAKHKAVGEATIRMLEKAGKRVVLPKGQVCCGGPLLWTGYTNEAVSAARTNIEVFNAAGVSEVVTACAGCGLMWKKEYPRLFAGSDTRANFRVVDLVEALHESGSALSGESTDNVKVAYFQACHLRSQKPSCDYRQVIGQWVERRGGSFVDADLPNCCGGMSASSDPRLAARLAGKVIEAAIGAGAGALVTTCPFCVENLDRAARRSRAGVRVLHISSLYGTNT